MRRRALQRPGLLLLLALGLSLGPATAAATSPPAPTPDQIAAQIEQAEQLRQSAADRGAEWLQTGSLIERAREAMASQEWQMAGQLARRAIQQSELAIEQSKRESTAWQRRVVR